ncbi:MAG TPA: SRPBCC family protein [Gammaproteobacteria bacterium]
MSQHKVEHASFTIDRRYDAPVALLFKAFADQQAKSRWFGGGSEWDMQSRVFDFRVGGREHLSGKWKSGMVSTFDAVYHDIVPEQRIVYAYDMHLDGRHISVSLATILFAKDGDGSKLTITEQGAFLDGYDDAGSREKGTRGLMERIADSLEGGAVQDLPRPAAK